MEVTFLSSTGSFGGVGYNLSKVYSNTAQVLEVANFDGLKYISSVPTINDYVEYLKLWSERNSRIRNTQFHVAISCKGHEKKKVVCLRDPKLLRPTVFTHFWGHYHFTSGSAYDYIAFV